MVDKKLTPKQAVDMWVKNKWLCQYNAGHISGLRIDRGKHYGVAVVDRLTLHFMLGDDFLRACDKIVREAG